MHIAKKSFKNQDADKWLILNNIIKGIFYDVYHLIHNPVVERNLNDIISESLIGKKRRTIFECWRYNQAIFNHIS